MTKSDSGAFSSQSTFVWIFAVFIVAFYFFGLTIPLVGPDEPRYAQVAREMFERGDWITPTLGGFNWFEKPALLYWLQIASYKIFGVSEFAARFGSALFGLGTVASLWILGNLSTAETRRGSISFANLLGLIAASSIGIIIFARAASFDIILTFPMTAALVAFYIFGSSERRDKMPAVAGGTSKRIALAAFYFFVGVSLLAKGLVGIIFPYTIVTFYYVLSWRFPSKQVIISFLWGTLFALLVASVWYLPMYLIHGWTFIDEFFVQHHFQRYTSNKYFHPQPFYFFLWVLPLMTLPWLPFFFGGIWSFFKGLPNRKDVETQSPGKISRSPLLLFSLSWLLVPLIFFSFSGSKLPGYILPAVPPTLIFAADSVYQFVSKGGWRRIAVPAVAFLTLAGLALAIVFVAPQFAKDDTVKYLMNTADKAGYGDAEVITMYHLSHNAEFYAAGRLHRNQEGKQKLLNSTEVFEEIQKGNGKPVLVIIPLEFLKYVTEDPRLKAGILGKNAESAIVVVSAL
jgi:4-amino-4-deoxy-L-arabinose transferase-like glycosyltransferase